MLSFKADALSRGITLMQSGIRQHLGLDRILAPAPITTPDPIPAAFAKPAKKAIAPFSADVGF
ncbi:MAG: hypothetical protein HYV07_27530 [Deltaproteobacteria bacterium]|nr:hypothetical protein [Deltaproteobacteria bacterium]